MGQFDFFTVANLGLEAAVDDCKAAISAEEMKDALESFDEASSKFSDAMRHRMELAHMKEKNEQN